MNCFIKPLLQMPEYKELITEIKNYRMPLIVTGPSESQKAHISFSVGRHVGLKTIFVAFNEMQARKIYEDLHFFLKDKVLHFPAKEIMLHDIEAKSHEASYQRLDVIDKLLQGNFDCVVTSSEALMQKLAPLTTFTENIVSLSVGGRINLSDLSQRLVTMGYERVSIVEGKGQFSIRGGIADIYPINENLAFRLELFDDEIDSIRTFDTANQRSIEMIQSARVLPAREILYDTAERDNIIKRIKAGLDAYIKTIKGADHAKTVKTKINDDIEAILEHYYIPGLDRFIPFMLEKPVSVLDYLGKNFVTFIDEPSRFQQRIDNVLLEHEESCKNLMEKGKILPESFHINFNFEELENILSRNKVVNLSTIPLSGKKALAGKQLSIVSKQLNSYQGHMEMLFNDIAQWKQKKCKIIMLSGPKGRGERIVQELSARGVEAHYTENYEEELKPGQIIITHGILNKGFEYPSANLVVISDREVFGQDRKTRKPVRKKEGNKIKAFSDLNIGDYVVHQAHGIGQYVGLQQLVVENVKKDYLKIVYQAGDCLYIPTNQLDLIQKFIGSEGRLPKLNKLGGTEWAKTKSRVKESLRELAEELVKLYAQRQALKGFSFSKDSVWQKQMEDLFPYEETDDQLKCIAEIKADMENIRPMDRLLCGDVGYGKTEVAIRAVFKAIMDGKQVAYLVPTTVLAQQHFNNFKERVKDFPIKVEVVSRFRSATEQKKILKELKEGNVDVLVGTHRLLQKDVIFKDLGLLVVDEEQRFGVTHKEKLKNLKPDVDVLTLTATPIPRTLHMSLTGIRDISTLEDPPEERYPVQTYVMEHNHDVIRDAIIREIARNGQVFYLSNRVRSIHIKASELSALVPDARVAVAHGQMDEKQLEDIMFSFIRGDFDVLVCTTIIESGLDMPNVNTIIVEDADRMGLAQLYQLRGRVGRSNRLAYAYITYKKDKIMSEIAEKRLQAIREFTEFGSGFKIAMRDLEIRGAGNLLGSEQHGHMESVGYEMYCRLLDEAVMELKGEAKIEEREMSIDVSVNAYIDNEYIGIENQKIEMYKKIASIQDEQDTMDIEDELTDRYGDIPKSVKNLIQVALIKALASDCGFVSIQEKADTLTLQFKDNSFVKLNVLSKLMEKYKKKLMFNASSSPYISIKTTGIGKEELLDYIKILLHDIKNLQLEV